MTGALLDEVCANQRLLVLPRHRQQDDGNGSAHLYERGGGEAILARLCGCRVGQDKHKGKNVEAAVCCLQR